MATRFAVLIVETFSVCCPHCGEPQPAPDNESDAWMPDQLGANTGKRNCVSCDEPFHIASQKSAQFDTSGSG